MKTSKEWSCPIVTNNPAGSGSGIDKYSENPPHQNFK
jgi:hypothetical protein